MTIAEAINAVKQPSIPESEVVRVVETYITWKKGVTVKIADPRRFNTNPSPIARVQYQHELGLLMKAYEVASNAFLKHDTDG